MKISMILERRISLFGGGFPQIYCLREYPYFYVLCKTQFQSLVRKRSLPKVMKVTVSNKPISGAAKVPVERKGEGSATEYVWYDWNGRERDLFIHAQEITKKLLGKKTEGWIWIDWEPA